MAEREQADKLAKAIDDLLRGLDPELDDAELRELFQVAKPRRQAALDAAHVGDKYESRIWQRLLTLLSKNVQEARSNGENADEDETTIK